MTDTNETFAPRGRHRSVRINGIQQINNYIHSNALYGDGHKPIDSITRIKKKQPLLTKYSTSMPFLRQSISNLQELQKNYSERPTRKSLSFKITSLFVFLGFISIVYITSLYVDLSTDEGKKFFIFVVGDCLTMLTAEIFLSTRETFTERHEQLEKTIFPIGFALLFIAAGISLETGFGVYNELYIMLYCLVVSFSSFVIALRRNSQLLAIIATVAGLAMPFILEDAYETPIAVLYSSLVISATIMLYLYHGWFLLLIVSALSCWGTIHLHNQLVVARSDTDIIRFAVFVHWLQFWMSTMIRELTMNKFKSSSSKLNTSTHREMTVRRTIWFNLLVLIVCSHLLVTTYYNIAYWAHWALLKGGLYGVAAICFYLWEKRHPDFHSRELIYPNYVVSIILLSVGIWLEFTGDVRYLALSVEAFFIVLISNRTTDYIGMVCGCILWAYTLTYTIYVLVITVPEVTLLNREAMMQALVIAMVGTISHLISNPYFKLIFEGLVHSLTNMLLYREFAYSINILYTVTALYPAAVQVYAYFKGDSETVTFIRMVYGDILWLWLFISQTLPRILLIDTQSYSHYPFWNMVSVLDLSVVGLALQVTMIMDHRWQGSTRWIYLVMCNATMVALIYRDSGNMILAYVLLAVYCSGILFIGFRWRSGYIKLGGLLTVIVLLVDELLFGFTDVMWKGAMALFAGMVALGVIVLPSNLHKEDPVAVRALKLSQSGSFNLGKMQFDLPASPTRNGSDRALKKAATVLRPPMSEQIVIPPQQPVG